MEVKELPTITARNMKEFFYKDVICRFVIPKILIFDNGKQFDSKEFQEFCKELELNNDLHMWDTCKPMVQWRLLIELF